MSVRYSIPSLCVSILAIAGCTTEVGVTTGSASFGDATQSNLFAQSIEYRRGDYLLEVAERFAQETDDTVTFAFNRSSLARGTRRALDKQAAWLRQNPNVRVRVTGHTDLVGGEAYNDRLGFRRARAVSRYLVQRGVARSRIDAVESRGEREPIVRTEEKERRNRRSLTEVAGFTHGFIGDGMDGRRALLMYRRYVSDSVQAPATVATSGGSG